MEPVEVARVVASIAPIGNLERIGGGSETDVYRADDGHYVIKVKRLRATTLESAAAEVEAMQAAAQRFASCLGSSHTIRTDFVLSDDSVGRFYAVAVQCYLSVAHPLAAIDISALDPQQRAQVEWQLLHLLRQALRCYDKTGHMPDLYGTFSHSIAERQMMNMPSKWPQRIWHFFTQRLWSAHNLMLTTEPDPRVVLVDYDEVRWRGLWGRLYYLVCRLLFWRDLIWLVRREAKYRLALEAA
jgi:hypothetical protein